MPVINQFARYWIDHAEAVGAFVSGRAIFIEARCHSRGTAQRNKNPLAVGRRVNPTRPFAYRKGGHNLIVVAVNDGDITGAFVANKYEIARQVSARPGGEKGAND